MRRPCWPLGGWAAPGHQVDESVKASSYIFQGGPSGLAQVARDLQFRRRVGEPTCGLGDECRRQGWVWTAGRAFQTMGTQGTQAQQGPRPLELRGQRRSEWQGEARKLRQITGASMPVPGLNLHSDSSHLCSLGFTSHGAARPSSQGPWAVQGS